MGCIGQRMLYLDADMERRQLHRWVAIAVAAAMAVLGLGGLGMFDAGHDDCADNLGHDACVCVCACHAFDVPSASIELVPKMLASRLSAPPPPTTGVFFPAEIFRPPLA